MSAKHPGAASPALDRGRSLSRSAATDPADRARDDERDAVWLYAWSHDALRPTGELLAARLTSRAVIRPGSRVGRISPHSTPPAMERNLTPAVMRVLTIVACALGCYVKVPANRRVCGSC